MKLLHLLIVALLFLSSLWHGTAMAGLSVSSACIAASDDGKQDGTKQPEGEEEEEPECD